MWQRLCSLKRNFSWIQQKTNFPHRPMGKFCIFCPIELKFCFWLDKRRWHISGKCQLMFISYKFIKGFLGITFYQKLFLAETFMMCVNVFYMVRNQISVGSDKKWEISPYTNGGLWGNSLFFVGSSWNFVPGYIKTVDTHHESFS